MSERDPLNLIGQVVDEKYLVEKLVGEGGFASVYRATHAIWKKPVAIKFFSGLSNAPVAQRVELQQQFINEGALLTELSSQTANIVQARDVGSLTTPSGQWVPYMVLEWLDGQSLEAVLSAERARGAPPWTLEQVMTLLAPVAAALDLAHGRGVVHRDIKPDNLFVLGEARSAGVVVKVLDFGVAKMMTDSTQVKAALAKTGATITSFTPQYGAPEQFSRTYGATGPWTDVYALALVAVELLAGRPALEGDDVVQLAFASGHRERRPTPRALGVPLPDEVEAVFARALAVEPAERFERAGAFWAALEATSGPRSVAAAATVMAPSSAALPASLRAPSEGSSEGLPLLGGPESVALGQPPDGASTRPSARWGLALLALLVVAGGATALVLRGAPSRGAPAGASVTPPAASSAEQALVVAPSCPEDMIEIPAGQFFMGSDSTEELPAYLPDPRPSHNVKLDAYCIDRDEVTSGKYRACSDVGKCRRALTSVEFPGIQERQRAVFDPLCTGNDPERASHPINCVSWEMARDYCEAQGRRLPTEAEWEYATRGPDGRIYPWGDDDPTEKQLNACGRECLAWGKAHAEVFDVLYDADDGYPATAPVGSFPGGNSSFGLRDVSGNVWEWVADWDGKYTSERQTNPQGPATGEKKIIRGGAFNGWEKSWLRPSFRFAQVPAARVHAIGFRCARALTARP